ncbi:MAG: dephospho-CoA kinase [Acidimicrobiales bacterium]|nr:dephospho-CoA kinase [Acidimicrobiales bacterium]
MAEFAITGGIGSGKSTVADALVHHGAKLIDADRIVHELQKSGGEVFINLVGHFGEGIIGDDGELDRKKLAGLVFSSEKELEKLNSIVHPAVGKEMASKREAFAKGGSLILIDIPLLVTAEGELARDEYKNFSGRIVVDCDEKLAVDRLIDSRGFTEEDARARISKQATREQRLVFADYLIDNNGDLQSLERQVNECWTWMQTFVPQD